jgi:TrbL/VirB6 plasmid conjugal transfer protein
MDSLAYPIFTLVSMFVRSQFNLVMDDAYTRFVNATILIAGAVEVTYLIRFGFLIAFEKATDDVKSPNINELLYHGATLALLIALIKHGKAPLDFLISLRQMIIEGFTGKTMAGGEQVAQSLFIMDSAFTVSNIINSVKVGPADSGVKATAVNLALMAEVSPQITAGIMLLLNECLARVGMALLPLMVYAGFYPQTRALFEVWFQYTFALVIQMATLAITVKLAAEVTAIFVGATTVLFAASALTTGVIGSYIISELQQSVVQFGFGMTLTTLTIWFPSNAGSYAGRALYSSTTRVLVGGAVTKAPPVAPKKFIA